MAESPASATVEGSVDAAPPDVHELEARKITSTGWVGWDRWGRPLTMMITPRVA